MAVPTQLSDLSATAASNSPAGGDTVGTTMDDYLRAIQSIIVRISAGTDALATPALGTPASGTLTNCTGLPVNIAQKFTAPQRGTQTTDNDGSFDLDVTNNFKCTTAGNLALTFTNIDADSAGQSGNILFINGGNHTITAAATTKVTSGTLAVISGTGTYLLGYYCDGTNVYVAATGAMS